MSTLISVSESRKNAVLVHQQVVITRQMPMNNATNGSEDERRSLDRWFKAG